MASHRAPQHRTLASGHQNFLTGKTPHGLSKGHDICCNPIRVWCQKCDVGAFEERSKQAADLLQYEVRIAALERLIGEQALELEFLLKGAEKRSPTTPFREFVDAAPNRRAARTRNARVCPTA
jgi:transposase